jgi:sulfite reductase (NADPH) flavoprotein alpha-component
MENNIINELSKKMSHDLNKAVQEMGGSLSKEQVSWMAGYFAGANEAYRQLAQSFASLATGALPVAGHMGAPVAVPVAAAAPVAGVLPEKGLTLLFSSHSGNGKGFSKHIRSEMEARGIPLKISDMASFKPRDLKNEKCLLIIVSTHGEGVPPPSAMEMFDYLNSARAPRLEGLRYSILALGDKSYVHFCKAGVDLDNRLTELGAHRLAERVDCDVDFQDEAESWLKNVVTVLQKDAGSSAMPVVAVAPVVPAMVKSVEDKPVSKTYNMRNPFQATVLSKVNLNAAGSEKETYHVELSLEGSGLTYLPGDSCGLISQNAPKLVNELLYRLGLDGNEIIEAQRGKLLAEVLKDYEITVLTPDVLKKHNTFAASPALNEVIFDVGKLREYLYGRDFIDLMNEYPVKYTAADLLTVLRPIPARLYSIASSPLTYPDEAHLLVSVVRFNAFGRNKEGVASTFWADRILENGKVPVYIKSNEGFRLPSDPKASIIMVGPGTGVAPFRSFIEERAALGHTGRNWLFFGNPHFTTDFLYQTEWQTHLNEGRLTRMDVAFSRDQQDKIYVQHKLIKQAREIYSWMSEGAYIYVCGDMRRMAPDVNAAFVEIYEKEGGMDHERAVETVKGFKKNGRYLEDVY